MTPMNRRTFLKGAAAGAAILAGPSPAWSAQSELDGIRAEIGKRHDEAVRRLQEWIHQPSIAAENRGVSEGCDLTIRLLRKAGFDPPLECRPMASPASSLPSTPVRRAQSAFISCMTIQPTHRATPRSSGLNYR